MVARPPPRAPERVGGGERIPQSARLTDSGFRTDLNPPPTLMPTARLLTNGALGVVFPRTIKLILRVFGN
ncbi:hypothetical protein [Scytonema sp. HK-05]|uniref:hypothetical protein n=1 Tax=Scytonema sp. HK-05 TaxID=1137095 RepID=UPI000A9FC49E|nr:hypothetical protein [Scytonema sp. HK-05]